MIQLKYDYLLPIGSVVKLKKMGQRMMIMGVLQNDKTKDNKTFDYSAVPYPEGLHDARIHIGFNQDDIETVVFRGYEDDERKAFLLLLEAMSRKMENKRKESV